MIALYTEVFKDYLEKHDVEGHFFHDTIKPKFDKFPNYTLGDLDFSFYNMFIEKYDLYEIGCETEQLFEHYLNEKLNELIVEFIPKINTYIANFETLLSRKVRLDFENNLVETPEGKEIFNRETKNDNYLNPIYPLIDGEQENVLSNNDKSQSIDERTFDNRKTTSAATGYREQAYSYFKTNPDMLNEVMELKNIYNEAINKFERCFMVIV